MNWSVIVIIEIGLVFGGVLLWGGRELWILRREKALDEAKARQAQGAPPSDPAIAPASGPPGHH